MPQGLPLSDRSRRNRHILAMSPDLGIMLGAITVIVHLLEGAAGLPVFQGTPDRGISLAFMTSIRPRLLPSAPIGLVDKMRLKGAGEPGQGVRFRHLMPVRRENVAI